MSIKVRYVYGPQKKSDKYLQDIEDIDCKFFGESVSYKPKEKFHWWLVFDDDKIVGYAGLDTTSLKDKAFLCRAGVLPEYRGLGIHKKLIKARERMAKKLGFDRVVTYTSHDNIKSSNSLIKRGYLLYRPGAEWGINNATYFSKEL